MVERLVATVDGARDDAGGGTRTADDRAAGDLDGLVDVWADLVKRSLHAMIRLPTAAGAGAAPPNQAAGGGAAAGAATVDVGSSSVSSPLRMSAGRSTAPSAATELWLHNGTPAERRDLRLHCGELRSHQGASLLAHLRFDPDVVTLPPRSSRGIVVTLELADDRAAPGTYRGVVLVSGLPDAWLPVEVVVSP